MKKFVEQEKLNRTLELLQPYADIETLAKVDHDGSSFPIYGLSMGSKDKKAPVLGLFAGVHGLEKIGSHVLIQHLNYLAHLLKWNQAARELMKKTRLVCIPIVNPAGMFHNRRSTMTGIDIIRNGPDCMKVGPKNLVSGHRISPKLPWYMGQPGEMALETKTLINFVKKEIYPSDFAFTLDLHSGFGLRDRLWFPYSKNKSPFPFYKIAQHFKTSIKKGMPYHIYKVEPQSESYLINGDPWDHLFDEYYKLHFGKKIFIPWTLEMGSWLWVRKNPKQIFSFKGMFNPVVSHRYKRVLRRHRFLLNYLHQVVCHWQEWSKV